VMLALVPIFIPVVFLGLEVIFGFVQALVFALLTMTYITLAIAEHRQHESGDEHTGHQPEEREASPTPGTA